MVVTLILVHEVKGDLHDQEGHLRNAACQRLDAQGSAIHESDIYATGTTLPVDEVARPRTLADYNRPDQFYTNRSAIRSLTIQGGGEFRVEAAVLHTRGKDTLLSFSLWIRSLNTTTEPLI